MKAVASVGLQAIGGAHWVGGVNYVVNMARAIHSLPEDERPEIHLIESPDGDIRMYREVRKEYPYHARRVFAADPVMDGELAEMPAALEPRMRPRLELRSPIRSPWYCSGNTYLRPSKVIWSSLVIAPPMTANCCRAAFFKASWVFAFWVVMVAMCLFLLGTCS